MADESSKKKEPDALLGSLYFLIGTCAVITFAGICNPEINLSHTDDSETTPKTGDTVCIEDDCQVFRNATNALNGKDGYQSTYDASQERLVLSTFYECNGEYIRVNIGDDNYTYNELQIIEDGGKAVCYLTTVDFENYTPEGFYNAESIKLTTQNNKQNSKQKTLRNKH